MFEASQWHRLATRLRLSPRELEIAQYICDDETEDAMASLLGIAQPTVHSYTRRLYQKLGVCSRVQLLIHCFATHLEMTTEEPAPLE